MTGLPEIEPGHDLAQSIAGHIDLVDRDIVLITSKVVSKAEGRLVKVDPDDPQSHKPLVVAESNRIVRRRRIRLDVTASKGFHVLPGGVFRILGTSACEDDLLLQRCSIGLPE